MPRLSKQFHLEITVEQFLNGCSYIELQELDLLLGGYLKKAEHEAQRQAYREGKDLFDENSPEAEEVDDRTEVDEKGREWKPLTNKKAIQLYPSSSKLDFGEDF